VGGDDHSTLVPKRQCIINATDQTFSQATISFII